MTVGELKKYLEDKPDEKNVVFVSCSGMEWVINPKVKENPSLKKSNNGESEQVVVYIK